MLQTKPSLKTFYFALCILHLLLFIFAFSPMLFHPMDHMYFKEGDGLKNYFTLISYIKQPASDGMFHYTAMQYPYGDYIYFTDNTPLIAFALRMFSVYVTDISDYAIPIMHFFILLNVLIAPFIVWKILRKFTDNGNILMMGSLWLVWVSPLFIRIFSSTYNLSLSVFFFLTILLAIQISESIAEQDKKKLIRSCIFLFLCIFIASFMHLYYILMLGLPVSFFIFFSFIQQKKIILKKPVFILIPFVSLFCTVLAVLFIIHATDGYKDLRLTVPEGSNKYGVEVEFNSLYKAKNQINSFPFIGGFANYGADQSLFLGNFFLYGSLLLFFYALYAKVNLKKSISCSLSEKKLIWLFLLSAFISYSSACGDILELGKRNMQFPNFLNPLFYVQKVYPAIDQFRFLSRLGLWFYFMMQILFLVFAAKLLSNAPRKFAIPIYTILFLLLFIELTDYVRTVRNAAVENLFSKEKLNELPDVNVETYQAILPIPYYNVGCEDYDYTIDDNNAWSTYTYQLQLKTGLPLMSSKLSRTPPRFARQYFSIFLNPSPDEQLLNKLYSKPILVIYDSSILETSNRSPAKEVIEKGAEIINHYNMKFLFQDKNVSYYEWNVK